MQGKGNFEEFKNKLFHSNKCVTSIGILANAIFNAVASNLPL